MEYWKITVAIFHSRQSVFPSEFLKLQWQSPLKANTREYCMLTESIQENILLVEIIENDCIVTWVVYPSSHHNTVTDYSKPHIFKHTLVYMLDFCFMNVSDLLILYTLYMNFIPYVVCKFYIKYTILPLWYIISNIFSIFYFLFCV